MVAIRAQPMRAWGRATVLRMEDVFDRTRDTRPARIAPARL
jgi:hypothetical protein